MNKTVKVYADYLDITRIKDASVFKLLMYCLYHASQFGGMQDCFQVQAGELRLTIRSAATNLGWQPQKFKEVMKRLSETDLVKSKASKDQGTFIAIQNWEELQQIPNTPKAITLSEEAQAFFDAYPSNRRCSKKEADTQYKEALRKGATHQILMDALKAYKKSEEWKSNGGQFVPRLKKWFEEERWKNGVPTP